VALLLFVSLLCHNFPEGLAVVASTVESRELGMTVAIGILIHNIPEGIAIAVPCLAARPDNPWLAFWLASGSGLAEPAGAWMALTVFQGKTNIANVLSCVAGIMCMVAVMELYPEAFRHVQPQEKRGTQSIVAGTVCGILVMVATECVI
jgi:ZIP family zinc transporter